MEGAAARVARNAEDKLDRKAQIGRRKRLKPSIWSKKGKRLCSKFPRGGAAAGASASRDVSMQNDRCTRARGVKPELPQLRVEKPTETLEGMVLFGLGVDGALAPLTPPREQWVGSLGRN